MRILIVEDEEMAALMLKENLTEILKNRISSLKIVPSLVAAQCYLQENLIDLLFLDLELDNEDGFEIFNKLVSDSFQTIVVSANTQKALQAFEHSILDFIPKPYSLKRLQEALDRYEDKSTWKSANNIISVLKKHKIELVPFDEIYYIKRKNDDSLIFLSNGSHVSKKSLQALEKNLPKSFIRIHRSTILNLENLKEINIKSGGCYTAILNNDETLQIGRKYYPELKNIFTLA